jgi:hypothetical protein
MSYCLNPDCQKATSNLAGAKFCQGCGSKLLLGDHYRALKLIVDTHRTNAGGDSSFIGYPDCYQRDDPNWGSRGD